MARNKAVLERVLCYNTQQHLELTERSSGFTQLVLVSLSEVQEELRGTHQTRPQSRRCTVVIVPPLLSCLGKRSCKGKSRAVCSALEGACSICLCLVRVHQLWAERCSPAVRAMLVSPWLAAA